MLSRWPWSLHIIFVTSSATLQANKWLGNVPRCAASENLSITTLIKGFSWYPGKLMMKSKEISSQTAAGLGRGWRNPHVLCLLTGKASGNIVCYILFLNPPNKRFVECIWMFWVYQYGFLLVSHDIPAKTDLLEFNFFPKNGFPLWYNIPLMVVKSGRFFLWCSFPFCRSIR